MMEDRRVHRLGHRAFILFLSRRSKFAIFLFLLTGAVWFGTMKWLPPSYAYWGSYATELFLLISIAYLLMVLLRTYIEYHAYTYMFTRDAFVVTKGYMTRTEAATLYHQIQNVNIERSMGDRMTGVSSIVIFLAGGQHDSPHNRIVLPAVAARKAKMVQKELLVRARKHASSEKVGVNADDGRRSVRIGL